MADCIKCGKDTEDENGRPMQGLFFPGENTDGYDEDFYKKQMGKYYGKEITLCIECWLDAMVGKDE